MNVFLLADDHATRAQYHCDVHVNKMCLESVQLCNTALHTIGLDQYAFYQPTHTNHPWTEWAAASSANWFWLLDHARALGNEFVRRSDSNSHTSIVKLESNWIDLDVQNSIRAAFDSHNVTPKPLCMPDEYKIGSDPIESYRSYYRGEKVPQDWCEWSTTRPSWC